MINLREMKNELDTMIEERDAMDSRDVSMEEMSDMDYRIDGQYKDIAEVLVCDEEVMNAVQNILDRREEAKIVLEQDDFHYNDRLWNDFVWFFREIKAYHDWSENEIWYSMNDGDIEEFVEYMKENFDLEEAKVELNELIKEECEKRQAGDYTVKERNTMKKRIATAKAEIADYMLYFN